MSLKPNILVFLCIVLLLVFAGVHTYAQSDTLHIPTRQQWQQLTADKAFGYQTEKEGYTVVKENKNNPLLLVVSAIVAFLQSGFGQMLLWIALFLFAAWALYKIFLGDRTFLWSKKSKKQEEDIAPDELPDLANTDWELQLQKAIQANNLRLSIRYSYMLLLQLLQQKGYIQYRTDKTNYDYYHEIGTEYKQDFKQLTRQYEYAWYGNFNIATESYEQYMATFNHLKKALQ